ncbi:MAG: polysaccharide biosynthesis/export family protein [Burkholderiales bacterium]|nr:polysaccharide biosynthesis/export family protein [Burkholderiales bacterium]
MKKIKYVLSALAVCGLASCASYPGQYMNLNEESAAAVDYTYSPIDAITVQALKNAQEFAVLPPQILRANRTPKDYEYLVGIGDLVRVTVYGHPDLTNPAGITTAVPTGQLVGADGTFFFPFLDRVKAEGRTLEQIRLDVTKGLAKVLKDPQVDVTISLNGFRSKKVYLSGEVNAPSFLPISDVPVRITDALALAQGSTKDADLENVTLQREGKTYRVNLYNLLYKGDTSQNVLLQDGDTLNLPDRRLRKVFLMGEVIKPSSVVMPTGPLTLAEVLNDVGGLNQGTSNAAQIYVIRAGVDSAKGTLRPDIYHMDANNPASLIFADQFFMQPRDIVYVDPVKLVRVNRLLSTILPTLSVLPTVRGNIRALRGD